MNKNNLIDDVAKKTGLSKADCGKAIDAICKSIAGALTKGNDVRLVNFGTFRVAKRKATKGRNPRTGKPINIPASKQPKFRAGKVLKKAVNK